MRNLPLGRISKKNVPDAVRRSGVFASFGNKGMFGEYFDQLMFESHQQEHILGSAAQVTSEFATMTWSFSNSRFEDKTGSEVVPGDYERVAVIGMDTLTANMVIDNIKGLEMFHIGGTPGQTGSDPAFKLGDAGGGEPYKIKLGPNTENCRLDFMTDKPFALLPSTLTGDQKRYIANQGKNNHIIVNGRDIYNPSRSGRIIKLDALPISPYLIRMDGGMQAWSSDVSVDSQAWFRDLNIALGGYRTSGGSLIETQSRFTLESLIASSPWYFQVNITNRFFTDISTDDTLIHQRLSPTADFTPNVDFVNGSDVVTIGFVDGRNGMRIQSGSIIPGGSSGTTLLIDVGVLAANKARMIDALTGLPVTANATISSIPAIIDNSGAAAGSQDLDRFQGHAHETYFSSIFAPGTLAGSRTAPNQNILIPTSTIISDGINGTPRPHDQTQPRSTGVYYFYEA